ncbi:MAG: hypothetical protein ACR2PO_03940 [Methyloligellaceae bacterium]
MLRKLYWTFVVFPLVVFLVAIAVANRHSVRLVLDPFAPENPVLSIELPFFLYLAAAVIAGLMLGGLTTWAGQGKWRKTARRERREAAEWRGQADRLTRQIEASKHPQLTQASVAD